jgi:N-formylglutamate deformylase
MHYQFRSGNSPILLSMPHAGTLLPKDIENKMTAEAKVLTDVDWHLPILYDMIKELDITLISAKYARYVIDLNRSPDDSSLYPGLDVTSLCPIDTFAKHSIYLNNKQPDEIEIQNRIEQYWKPYHAKLESELKRIQNIHGVVILWDAHSIASHVPRFFSGKLPDFNIGTADMSTCSPELQKALEAALEKSSHIKNYSYVFNGRFKGGYITRHYGAPNQNIHAIQMEMSQCVYMEEIPPFNYKPKLAENVQPLLRELLEACLIWAK